MVLAIYSNFSFLIKITAVYLQTLFPIVWSIGSESQSTDVLPRTDVSFNNGRSATIADGVLLVDTTPLANLSDIIALADGVSSEVVRGLSFEPGRLLYHQLEFCSLAHTCVESDSLNSIVIRELIISHTHSLTCSLINSSTYTLTHTCTFTHSLINSSTYTLTHSSKQSHLCSSLVQVRQTLSSPPPPPLSPSLKPHPPTRP